MSQDPNRLRDGLRHKHRLLTCSNQEFNAEMEAINEPLQSRNSPLSGRELQGVSELCTKYGFSLALHEPLAQRISKWAKERYGQRLNADLSLGYCPILIRGDVYRMRVPMLLYDDHITCVAPPTHQSQNFPIINAIELSEDLPQTVAERLSTSEFLAIRTTFLEAKTSLEAIGKVRNVTPFSSGFGDLEAACDQLTKNRWHTHEDSAEQTVACVMWLLTSFNRIVETERRGAFVAGRLEKFEPPGQWEFYEETGLLFGLFGSKRHLVRVAHQQDVLPCPSNFLKQFAPGALNEDGLPVDSRLGSPCLLSSRKHLRAACS